MRKIKSYNLKIYTITNPPNDAVYIPVYSVDEGKDLINRLIYEQLNDTNIWGNVFGMVEFVDGQWSEWENEFGQNILEIMDEEESTE